MSSATNYEQLVDVAASVKRSAVLSLIDEAPPADCEEFVRENSAALSATREAVARHCSVGVEYVPDFWVKHQEAYAPLRDLARGLAIEARACADRGQWERVVEAVLCLFDLANSIRREGLVVDALLAIAVEGLAIEAIRPHRRRLGIEDAVRLANGIIGRQADREPMEETIARDRRYDQTVNPSGETPDLEANWPDCSDLPIDEETLQAFKDALLEYSKAPEDRVRQDEINIDNKSIATLSLLAIEAALVAFCQRRQAYPESLDELAPEGIASVPLDPFTSGPFRYKRTPAGFKLYSPGPTGRDHGGRFGGHFEVQAGQADLCLDVDDYTCCCMPAPQPSLLSRLKRFFRRP
jgi:hypothetical protein